MYPIADNRYEAEAFRAFDRWRSEHDPDGEMDILEAAFAYSQWAEKNSIKRYLDAAQSPSEQTANKQRNE